MKLAAVACAVLASVAFAAGQSQRPSPTPAKATQKQQDKRAEVQSKPASDQHSPGNAVPALTQTSTVVTSGNQGGQGNPQKQESPTNWWSVFNTILLTVFNGVLAYLAYRQWRTMNEQAKDMKEGGADTKNLAIAARDTAEAAKTQATTTQDQLAAVKRFARARVIIKSMHNPYMVGQGAYPQRVVIEFLNTGYTSARKFRWSGKYALTMRGDEILWKPFISDTRYVGYDVISDSFTNLGSDQSAQSHIDIPLLECEPADIEAGNVPALRIGGTIRYNDTFDEAHSVEFVNLWLPMEGRWEAISQTED